jgi:serine/threonine protein kinase
MAIYPAVPGFDLVRELGGGSLAQVFVARPYDSGTLVAVKRLRDEQADDPVARLLLRREAVAGLAVAHPHLVRVRDAHLLTPPYFLVLDLIEGESLRNVLKRQFRLDRPAAVWVARQAAEALAALHRAGLVHGDVKPENLLLTADRGAVLIDLGFAHRPGENAELFRRGYILGTANYLAPELCGPGPDADVSSDLYSLGVMLFELLTGELPYPTGPVPDTLARHRDTAAADLRDRPGDWPDTLADLVARLTSRRPSARPRAAVVVQELIALEIASLASAA